jgi:hypothetical protein
LPFSAIGMAADGSEPHPAGEPDLSVGLPGGNQRSDAWIAWTRPDFKWLELARIPQR